LYISRFIGYTASGSRKEKYLETASFGLTGGACGDGGGSANVAI
jgi:hypothetical protein